MNPAIHHPGWYLAMSLITQPEFDKSISNLGIVNSQVAQFENDGFSVLCLPERWQVSCNTADGSRILALAKDTFAKLSHTPVNAYGVNHDFHTETTKLIPSILMAIVRKTGLPFPSDEEGTAAITYTAEVGDATFKTVISASPRGPYFLQLQNNTHFTQESIGQFDLGPLLDEAFRRNENRSQLMLGNFVKAIQEEK